MFAPEYDVPDEIADLRRNAYHDPEPDDRLRILVYVDGRLVDSWAGSVRYSRWADVARAFDDERRPSPPPPPREPAHLGVLRWLEGVVGGREALLALDDGPTPPTDAPAIDDDALRTTYETVTDHLDRVSAELFDDEVQRVLLATLAALWQRAPETVGRRPPNELAGGLVWLVGRANDLFRGGLTQTTVQRELWMRRQLSGVGQGLASSLRGVDLYAAPRPHRCPDLMSFGNPLLLTADTRRQLVRWRDEALRAEATTAQS